MANGAGQLWPLSKATIIRESNWSLLVQAKPPARNLIKAALMRLSSCALLDRRIDDPDDPPFRSRRRRCPHLDHSMMCLLSGTGRRRWRVGEKAANASALPTSRPVKQVDPSGGHNIDEELEPGDILYIPP